MSRPATFAIHNKVVLDQVALSKVKARYLAAGVLLGLSLLGGMAAKAETFPSGTQLREVQPLPSLAPMLEQVTPAVVNIAVVKSQRMPDALRFFGQPGEPPVRRSRGAGSGVVVDAEEGLIITNHHVVSDADSISVALADGRVFQAEMLGSDERTDIALLQIDAENLTAIAFANAAEWRVGDYVVAIGNPFGIGQTVTSGIISALGRAGINNENYEDFIQTDAAINVGNSGGALVDLNGELVGINTAIISGSGTSSGVGFAVPVDMVNTVMEHLLRDGEVRRGQLGVIIRDHTPALEQGLQLGADSGALITQVAPDSAAERAGLQVSDLVVAVDGQAIESSRDLRNIVGLAGVGRELTLSIYRDGRRQEVEAFIAGDAMSVGGATNDADRDSRRADDNRFFGALLDTSGGRLQVSNIDQRSPAWAAGLRPGDTIVAFNRREVASLAELNELINEQPSVMALTVQRDDQRLLLIMP
ncbi:Do family serine endopeptidase [Pseudohongiella spirulinae]|nr:Do family serine endopeptidase [Pseudohongiella spirulinae]